MIRRSHCDSPFESAARTWHTNLSWHRTVANRQRLDAREISLSVGRADKIRQSNHQAGEARCNFVARHHRHLYLQSKLAQASTVHWPC